MNDGSSDGTSKIAHALRKDYKSLRVIDKKNGGKASALNVGIEHARGEMVACMDADSMVDKRALKQMVGYFRDTEVAAVTSSMKVSNRERALGKAQAAEYLLNIFLRKILTFMDALPVTPGPFSIYRKSVVQRLGGFEGDNLVEDMDMAFKLHSHGYKIETSTRARVWTICPDTLRGVYPQRVRWYRGLVATSFKYKDMFFNPAYGNLGVFFLPLNFLAIALVSLMLGLIVYSTVSSLSQTIWNWNLVGFDLSYIISSLRPPDLSVMLLDTRTMLMASSTLLGVALLFFSFRQAGEKVRQNPAGFVSYMFVFPFLMMVFWSVSLVHELIKSPKGWQREKKS